MEDRQEIVPLSGTFGTGDLRVSDEVMHRRTAGALRACLLEVPDRSSSATAVIDGSGRVIRTIGYEELLSDGITDPVNPAQRAQLARIKVFADHLLALIEEILTIARVDARTETLHLTTVPLADLVETTAAFVAPMAAGKGLTSRLTSPPPVRTRRR